MRKPGEDEEKVHSNPADAEVELNEGEWNIDGRESASVVEENQKDCNCA